MTLDIGSHYKVTLTNGMHYDLQYLGSTNKNNEYEVERGTGEVICWFARDQIHIKQIRLDNIKSYEKL
jgi:hypothetical protein